MFVNSWLVSRESTESWRSHFSEARGAALRHLNSRVHGWWSILSLARPNSQSNIASTTNIMGESASTVTPGWNSQRAINNTVIYSSYLGIHSQRFKIPSDSDDSDDLIHNLIGHGLFPVAIRSVWNSTCVIYSTLHVWIVYIENGKENKSRKI